MEENEKKFKVGDKLVEFGQVFRIFKIETKENNDGEKERILHFRPFYKSENANGMICSIPESSVSDSSIRRPHPKSHIKEILKKLSEKPKKDMETDADSIKSLLALNDPHETVRAIRGLWIEQATSENGVTKSKRDMFSLSTTRLVEEVAYVMETTPEKTESKIHAALRKLAKPRK